MKANPFHGSLLAVALLAGTATCALAQSTDTTAGQTTAAVDHDDDGFDLGWIGLLGLLGLAGLRRREQPTSTTTTRR
jgi:hypothetical protein